MTFHIGLLTICTNTGTYLDVPFHRYADGHDLADLALEQVAGVPAVCSTAAASRRSTSRPTISSGSPGTRCSSAPTTQCTSARERTSRTTRTSSAASAEALVAADVACVGIDSMNIDGTATGDRPVHSILLRRGSRSSSTSPTSPRCPDRGFTFTAVPPKIEGAGTFTVRAFATTDEEGQP